MSNNEQYEKEFSNEGFWDKVTKYAKKGREKKL